MHPLLAIDLWLMETDAVGGWLLPILLLWVILAIATGKVARDRGRGLIRWVFVALLISPVLAYPLLRGVQRMGASQEHNMPLGSEIGHCPTCGETVSASLSNCTSCGEKLPTDT
ncbi:MAG: hypothetical protein BRD27_04625 [Bacteroidetes bacterium QH_10_64_19]|jgi:hypothetical protein|nr:MAG: hypothetical protein BRD27_04625 [Bacteroidetes bacterium QH_10_64_19]